MFYESFTEMREETNDFSDPADKPTVGKLLVQKRHKIYAL